MDYLNQLNEKQYEAVLATEGYVRVIAGAGSGKTKLLVSRYAYLVKDCGIDPANILSVTFTNKAAGEMKRRIRAIVGEEYDTSLICTYHGFAARLLRDDADKMFLSKDFQILDGTQQKTILGEIYQKRELKLDYASFERILKKIGEYKTEKYAEYVPKMSSPERQQIMSEIATTDDEIIEEYVQREKSVNALDFHDLISFALVLLETNEEVREKWQRKLNYIMVDEFQDSSKREMKLVDILSEQYLNLMIVGDPDQNIYEWRGSDVKLLVEFDKHHIPTNTIFLNRNYRSTPQILNCANELIDKNAMRLKKDLYTANPAGADVFHYHSKTEEEENRTLAGTIKSKVKTANMKYSDFAVLYRSGFLSRVVENKLVEENIPYEIYGGVKFFQRMEVQDLIAYLKLIAYSDDLSFKRIVNKPRRRFGRTKMSALEELQEQLPENSGKRLIDVLEAHIKEKPFSDSDTAEFVAWVRGFQTEYGKLRIPEIVNKVSAESGYEEYIRSLGDEERYENLMEFKRVADEFERNFGEDLSLTQFLQQLSLQSNEDEDTDRDAVKLMTIHAAKGLEFPFVFLIGLSEGIFPSSKTIEERKEAGLEEERRLCYVAITRAMKQLFLMDSEGTSVNGIKKLPSRFLREIGEHNYIRIGTISPGLAMESKAYQKRLDGPADLTDHFVRNAFAPGKEVTHHIFGKGTVLSVDQRRQSLLVEFEKIKGTRNISMDYFERDHQLPARMAMVFPEKREPAAIPKPINALPKAIQTINPEHTKIIETPPVEHVEPDEILDPEDIPKDEAVPEDQEVILTHEKIPKRNGNVTIAYSETSTVREDSGQTESAPPDRRKLSPELKQKLAESPNLWKRDDVPHTGWTCVGVTDLGAPVGVCEMCGYQIIRYVHHMVHPQYRSLGVGCICAGKMEGDIERARKREQDFKSRASRRESFITKKWKISRSGNIYQTVQDHVVVLCVLRSKVDQAVLGWKYSIDSVFGEKVYKSIIEAKEAAFDALERIKVKAENSGRLS